MFDALWTIGTILTLLTGHWIIGGVMLLILIAAADSASKAGY